MNRNNQVILLVDDNPDDVELTLLVFRKSKILNEVVASTMVRKPSTTFMEPAPGKAAIVWPCRT